MPVIPIVLFVGFLKKKPYKSYIGTLDILHFESLELDAFLKAIEKIRCFLRGPK